MHIGTKEIREKFNKICVEDGRFIVLIFGQSDMSEINSAKIIGKDDNLEAFLAIAADAEHACLGVMELGKAQSAFINTVNESNRIRLEAIISGSINCLPK